MNPIDKLDVYYNMVFWQQADTEEKIQKIAFETAHIPSEKKGGRFPGGTVHKDFRYPRDKDQLDEFISRSQRWGIRNIIYVTNFEAPDSEIKQVYGILKEKFANVVVEFTNEPYLKENLGLNIFQAIFFQVMARWIYPAKARAYYNRGKQLMKKLNIGRAIFALGSINGLHRYWNQEIKFAPGIIVTRHWYPEPTPEWWENEFYKEVEWLVEHFPGHWLCTEGARMNFGFDEDHERNMEYYGDIDVWNNTTTMMEVVAENGGLGWVHQAWLNGRYGHFEA